MDKWEIQQFAFKALAQNEIRGQWIRWKRNFEYVVAASGEKDQTKLKFLLLARAGPDVQEVFQSIPDADVDESDDVSPYKVALCKLDEYFAPKHHDSMERNIFWTLKPEAGENLEKFMLRAREQANKCDFGVSAFQNVGGNVNRVFGDQSGRVALECSRCGRRGHLGNDPKCPARDKECGYCKRVGHFARKCKTASSKNAVSDTQRRQDKRPLMKGIAQRIRTIPSEEAEVVEEEKPQSFIFSIGDGDEFIWLKLGGVMTQMLIDSGSRKNIIDGSTWNWLKSQNVVIRNATKKVDQKFRGYGMDAKSLEVIGMFDSTIRIPEKNCQSQCDARFYVIRDGNQPLLGKETAKELDILRLGLPDKPNQVAQIVVKSSFPKMKGIKLHIPIDKSVTPVVQHARRPPIALLGRIEEKLDHLEAADIIEKVNQYSDWVSPLVIIVKDSGDLRICVDMRVANRAIKREHHLMPTIEDFLPRLKSAKYFSRLDIKDAFHQIELDELSRPVTTFITHRGMYRYKRLMFGVSRASEMFQKIIDKRQLH
ncbi:uncharacterized protein K02A2.6-like [Armigeres subalbatus]|uniref:uncharacterized protein K02A2.6-like n=1 Tax=Armigeres subalbatus TaxID=124917 RepID=UPI002ED3368F